MSVRSMRWLPVAVIAAGSLTGSCASDYNEMTLAVVGMRAAVGDWNPPELVTLVLYAPRPTGSVAPIAPVRFRDPAWNSASEERRVVPWNGEDRMMVSVAWPRGTITEVRVQAVIATRRCGLERAVLATGAARGLQWQGSAEPSVTVTMQAQPQTLGVESMQEEESCR